jgi:hypothetical protein
MVDPSVSAAVAGRPEPAVGPAPAESSAQPPADLPDSPAGAAAGYSAEDPAEPSTAAATEQVVMEPVGVGAYAIGDVHGCLDQLRAALQSAGFTDEEDRWLAGNTRLWFLGDLTDRGPNGVGVIELVMSLQQQAAKAGGEVGCLLGNHELMLLTAHLATGRRLRLLDADRAGDPHTVFRERWLGNGGKSADSLRINATHLAWIAGLPALAMVGEHLLMHADALGYREYGENIDEVNAAIAAVLADRTGLDELDRLTHVLTKRFAFASDDGHTAREFLRTFGGRQLVHGHSPVPLLLDIAPSAVTGPLVYAGGYAVNLDTGVFLGGPCLIAPLPSVPRTRP